MKLWFAPLIGLVLACAALHAKAQPYPVKAARIVVPYPPGGATDIAARLMAQALTTSLGQSFVVENRAGAGGLIALEQVANSPADGYTLIVASTGPAAISPLLYKARNFDPLARLDSVIQFASAPGIVVVRSGLKVQSIRELLALSSASPGALTLASAGNGSLQHLLGVLLQNRTDVKWVHVPFKGSAPALNDLAGDRVDVMVDVVPSAAPFVKGGRVRALAVTTQKRSSQMPEVPTLEELGYKGFDYSGWHALFAPKGSPAEAIARLNTALNEALRSPEMKEKLAAIGADADGGPPSVLDQRMRRELSEWGEIIRQSSITPD